MYMNAGAVALTMLLMIDFIKTPFGYDGMFLFCLLLQIISFASTCTLVYKDFRFDYELAFEVQNKILSLEEAIKI